MTTANVSAPSSPDTSVGSINTSEEDFTSIPSSTEAVDEKVGQIANTILSRVKSLDTKSLKVIGKGSAKLIAESPDPTQADRVVVMPTKSRKRKEVVEDFAMADTIRGKTVHHDFLSVEKPFEEDKENGTFVVKRACGDLSESLKKNVNPEKRIQQGYQVLAGVSELHEGGLVHGDLKPDNFFLYGAGGRETLKLADWGKTRNPKDQKLYEGNRKFMPAEQTLSYQSETYSSALVLMRILEAPFLTREQPTLTNPLFPKGKVRQGLVDSKEQGITRYLCSSDACPQGDLKATSAVIRLKKSKTETPARVTPKATAELNHYIDALCARYPAKGAELGRLLRDMTHPDPSQRISMDIARDRYGAIFPDECARSIEML